MLINRKRLVLRVFIYLSICALMMGAIHLFSASAINRIPAFNPLLFPVLTILLFNTPHHNCMFYGNEILV